MQVLPGLIFILLFFAGAAFSQTCNTASIPASTPDNQLTDNGNNTVTDNKTGLMWKKCVEGVTGSTCDSGSAGSFTWQQALAQPAIVNNAGGFAGYSDWRLPNIKELTSIVEEQCYDPAINLNRFPNATSSYVWSGSPHALDSSYAWYVNFYHGGSDGGGHRNSSWFVRLVRGGQ